MNQTLKAKLANGRILSLEIENINEKTFKSDFGILSVLSQTAKDGVNLIKSVKFNSSKEDYKSYIDKIDKYFDWDENEERLIELQNEYRSGCKFKSYIDYFDHFGEQIRKRYYEIVNEPEMGYKISRHIKSDLRIYELSSSNKDLCKAISPYLNSKICEFLNLCIEYANETFEPSGYGNEYDF